MDPPGRERALSTLFMGTPFRYKRADDESDEHPPLRVGSPNINPGTAANDQYTLSRVFPLPTQGDLPLNFELIIAPETAIGNIALWEENNEKGIFSYSVRDLLLSPWFEAWLGGVLSQPHYFETTVRPFAPHLSASYDAAYGASLVSRRMGMDLLEQ